MIVAILGQRDGICVACVELIGWDSIDHRRFADELTFPVDENLVKVLSAPLPPRPLRALLFSG